MNFKSVVRFAVISTIVIGLSIVVIHHWLNNKTYLLDDKIVAQIAEKYVGLPHEEAFDRVYSDLMKMFPGHILPPEDTEWMFVCAGGWKGAMRMIHASVTEYVTFFGTAVDTVGHSGRYWANISDTVMTGTFRQWTEGTTQSQVFIPGDTILHAWGDVTMVQWSQGTWMVEYGRGFIPSTMPFALSDTISSTQDVWSIVKVVRMYIKFLSNEMLCFVNEMGS
ncbi:sigma non-opioid intracellular receptor 1-like [Asterias amurensis]|uniref:sigma non-opioid intracellular receptor 1-like n=1 Tax=Asterias amurensis TaxID=7602 RepID=UPI003AB7879A